MSMKSSIIQKYTVILSTFVIPAEAGIQYKIIFPYMATVTHCDLVCPLG
jgi:hypothetical protein